MDVSFGLIQKQTHVQTSMTSLVSEQRPYSMILFIAYKLFTKTFKSFWSVTISASLNDVNSSSHHSVLFLTPFLVPLVGERRNAWNTCKFVLILPPQCPHNLRGYSDLWPCSPNLKLNRKCQMIHTCPLLLAPCFHKLSWCSDNMDGGGDRDRAPPCCWASSRVS